MKAILLTLATCMAFLVATAQNRERRYVDVDEILRRVDRQVSADVNRTVNIHVNREIGRHVIRGHHSYYTGGNWRQGPRHAVRNEVRRAMRVARDEIRNSLRYLRRYRSE